MDASGTERSVFVCLSRGAQYLLELSRIAPERIAGAAFIGDCTRTSRSNSSAGSIHARAIR